MTRMTKAALTLTILTSLTACDSASKRDLRQEREDGTYRAAMADYQAGRIDQAVAGFEKVLDADPGNASARFQLACIQQDLRHDYVAAYCGYREYLRQQPASDKAVLAKDRLALCEGELAKQLAEKYGLTKGDALAKEAEAARKACRVAEAARIKLEQDLAESARRIAALEADRKRLVTMMKTDTDNESQKPTANVARDVKSVLEEEDQDEGDRIRMSQDVAALRSEEKSEMEEASSLLPEQAKDAKARRDAAQAAAKQEKAQKPAEPLHEAKPETYVIQEGDTLIKIALRFYGTKSAWLRIRNANKAIITTDGRVRAGDEIRLP